MKTGRLATLVAAVASIGWAAPVADAQPKRPGGNAAAGHTLALQACTGCHLVESDQPFKPIFAGKVHPPDFKDIANKPNVTAASLIHYLETLPTIPQDSRMANPDLTQEELRDVAAFILTLRGKPGG